MGLGADIFFWTVAKAGRGYGRFKGYLKNTSTAKKIFDGFNVVNIGSDLVDALTGTEKTGSEASLEYKTVTPEELKEITDREKDKNIPTITTDLGQREKQPVVITDYYKKFPDIVGQKEGDKKGKDSPVITIDPDQRELQPTVDREGGSSTNSVPNTGKNTLNKLVGKLLDQSLLADDDNNQETAYLYDLYFVNSVRDIALKRWPTIRNYHNAYSFAGMLKEIKEESTYEEMVLILFYFRMV